MSFSLDELRNMPARTQITRHDCVEGWSCIAKWTGTPLAGILDQVKVKPQAKFAVYHCYDNIERGLSGDILYYESSDLIDARHPQTILAYGLNNETLPVANGAPIRIRIERALGYKQPKYVHTHRAGRQFRRYRARARRLLGGPRLRLVRGHLARPCPRVIPAKGISTREARDPRCGNDRSLIRIFTTCRKPCIPAELHHMSRSHAERLRAPLMTTSLLIDQCGERRSGPGKCRG